MSENLETSSRAEWKKLLSFSLLTLLILFVLVEVTWRIVCFAGLSIPPSGDRNLDKEWEWIVTTRAKGKHPITEGPFRYDPILGWGLLPGFSKENLHINSHGQRGLIDWPLEKDPVKTRIMILGDSYTFGYDVGDTECYASALGSFLGPDWEVINWGVPGYGTDQQVLLYEKFGARFAPDFVILGFYTPDLFRNSLRFYSYIKPVFQIEGGRAFLADEAIPSPTALLAMYERGEKSIGLTDSYLRAFLRRELEDMRRDRVDEGTLEWPVTEKILTRFSEDVRANGATPLLLIIPDKEVLKKEGSASTDIAALLKKTAQDLNMPCLDMIPILREKNQSGTEALYEGHWTPYGHKVCAEALAEVIRNLNRELKGVK